MNGLGVGGNVLVAVVSELGVEVNGLVVEGNVPGVEENGLAVEGNELVVEESGLVEVMVVVISQVGVVREMGEEEVVP